MFGTFLTRHNRLWQDRFFFGCMGLTMLLWGVMGFMAREWSMILTGVCMTTLCVTLYIGKRAQRQVNAAKDRGETPVEPWSVDFFNHIKIYLVVMVVGWIVALFDMWLGPFFW